MKSLRRALALAVTISILTGGLPLAGALAQSEPSPSPSESPEASPEGSPEPTSTPDPSPNPQPEPDVEPEPEPGEPSGSTPSPESEANTGGEAQESSSNPSNLSGDVVGTPDICEALRHLGIACTTQSSLAPPDVVGVVMALVEQLTNLCPGVACPDDVMQRVQTVLDLIGDIEVEVPDTGPYIQLINNVLDLVVGVCPNLDCVPNIDVGPYLESAIETVNGLCPNLDCVPDTGPYIQLINNLLDLVVGVCPNLDCVPDPTPTLNTLLGIVGGICPGLQCTTIITGLVDSLVRTACGTEGDCVSKVQSMLDGLIDSRCPNGIAACADEEIALVLGAYDNAYNTIYNTVCPNGEFFQDCGYRYITIVTGLVDGLIDSRCPNGIAACADEEIALVLGAYDNVYNTIYNAVCPNGEFFQDCGYRYITIVTGLVGSVTRLACPPNGDLATCPNDEIALVLSVYDSAYNTIYNSVCPNGEFFQDCGQRYLSMVTGVIDEVYRTACSTRSEVECANYLANTANIIVTGYANFVIRTICGDDPLAQCGDDELDLVLGVYDYAYNTIYNSVCPNGEFFQDCGYRYITIVTGLVGGAAKIICPPTGDLATCRDSETDLLLATVDEAVEVAVRAICPQAGATPECLPEIGDQVNDLVTSLANMLCNSDASSGTQACVDMASQLIDGTIETLLRTICPQTGGTPECLGELGAQINALVTSVTNIVCQSTSSSGPQACIDMVDRAAKNLVATHCPELQCPAQIEDQILTTINNLVANYCPELTCPQTLLAEVQVTLNGVLQELCGAPTMTACVTSIEDLLFSIIETHCPGLQCPDETIQNIQAIADALIAQACGPSLLVGCKNQLVTLVNSLLDDPCYQYLDCIVTFPEGPDSAYPDVIKSMGTTCQDVKVLVSLYMPYGVTRKSVTVGHADNSTCSLEVGPILTEGQPGGYEPHGETGDFEGSANGTSIEAMPLPPSDLIAASVAPTQINVRWKDNSGNEDGFKIERATTSGGPFNQVSTLGPNATTFNDVGLSPSSAYYYRVRAYNTGGDSLSSNEAAATTDPPPPPPAAPSNVNSTVAGSSEIRLSWVDNSGNEDGFKIERATTSSGPFNQVGSLGPNATAFGDTGLNASSTYYYRIHAFNLGGNSAYSSQTFATTDSPPPPPSAPAGLWAETKSSSQIDLRWTDNATNENGFKIERASASGGTFVQIDTVGPNASRYSDAGLNAATTYYYRVRSYGGGGDSGYSNQAHATTDSPYYPPESPSAPNAPSALSAGAVSSVQANLEWTDNATNEDGFRIYRAMASGGPYVLASVVPTNTTSFSDSGLQENTTYYYRIRAYGAGGESNYSNEAAAATQSYSNRSEPPTSPKYTATSDSGGGEVDDAKCYGAKDNWIHTGMTIQGAAWDDLGWTRSAFKRLWGCRSTWWSERSHRVKAWSGTSDGATWWDASRPEFKFTKWSCHPPGECRSAPAGFLTHFEVNNNNTPCHGDTGRTSIDITTHVNTFDNGDKSAWWVRDGHCTYLDYPHDSKIVTNGCPWGPSDAQKRAAAEAGGDWHEGCNGYGSDGDDRFAYAIPPS